MSQNEALAAIKAQKKLDKKLDNTFFESESKGLVLTVNGKWMIQGVVFEDKQALGNEKQMISAITEAWNKVNMHVTKMQKEEYAKLEKELKEKVRK